jgi:hypothetical protein
MLAQRPVEQEVPTFHPADENFPMPDGSKGYPETVVLRLKNRPELVIKP